jgi:preprotein translocase SecF subunit
VFAVKVNRDRNAVLGVDFTGGAAITLSYAEKVDLATVRKALQDGGISDAGVQYQSTLDNTEGTLLVKSSFDTINGESVAKLTQKALDDAMPEKQFKVIGDESIGPAVGRDLRRDAVRALIISFIGIVIYITLRFQFGFALGAIIALIHDVLITFGIFILLGRQVNLTTVAALLTIVGYSINDTIVTFDRIRETMLLDQRSSFKDIANRAINQTLSRILLTTLTTMLAVFALLIFGGGAIRDFALALMIGMVFGTYSSLFIATPLTIAWYRGRRPVGLGGVKK